MRNITRKSLERPYSGPHKIVERVSDRVYKIDVKGPTRSVSTELLKPAYFLSEGLGEAGDGSVVNQPGSPAGITPLKTYSRQPRVTFAGSTK